MHPQSRIHKIFDTLGLRPYRTVFGRNFTHTVPSAVLTLGIQYGSLLVLYRTTAVNIQPYAVYGTACSPSSHVLLMQTSQFPPHPQLYSQAPLSSTIYN